MAIWLKFLIIAGLIFISSSLDAQELIKVPVQIPAITPAATAFAVSRDRGYYRQEGLDVQLIVMPSALGTQALIGGDRKSTRLNSSHSQISYAVFCLKKK